MRRLTVLGSLCAFILGTTAAAAETRIFLIANSPDGYGVDQCLATGARCGLLVANAYCQSRDYLQAASFRRVAAGEITNSVLETGAARAGGDAFVAIECSR